MSRGRSDAALALYIDHKQGLNRKLEEIPVENPVSITGGSGSYPHRQLHRDLLDNNPMRQVPGEDDRWAGNCWLVPTLIESRCPSFYQ